jgi:NADP-dependent 3-hydroxy acid dehydrogenase YdfG
MSRKPTTPPALPQLEGLRVLVSGGTTGIGRATAHRLVRCGANVLVFGRHRRELRDCLADAPAGPGTIDGMLADQARAADVARVFTKADRRLGGIDVLVNNAAIANDGILDGSDAEIAYVINSNVTGYLLCTRHALRRMLPRRRGQIINVGSMTAEKRGPGGEVYTATKAANRGFSDALRRCYGPKGIRVCLIEPGKTATDLIDATPAQQRARQRNQEMLTAEDVAECILFCIAQPKRVSMARVQIVPLRHQS